MVFSKLLVVSVSLVSFAMVRADTILSYDFNGANPWPDASTDVLPSTPLPVEPSVDHKPVGTVDVAKSTDPSGGMLFSTQVGAIKDKWEAILVSGLLPVKNAEAELGKLTLAFDLSASIARPVTVRFSSFNDQKRLTGTLEASVLPAAANFYQRSAIDLSTMKAVGPGKFQPTDPYVQIVLTVEGPMWPSETTNEVRLDNVHYANPAFYVSPQGDDKNDGKTESKPLADPQTAMDRAKPGDIVLLMAGEYNRGPRNTVQDGIVAFRHSGSPAGWITLKNYPGQKPILRSDAWNTIQIRRGKSDSVVSDDNLGYLEVRGLHIKGYSVENKTAHADEIGTASPNTNGNGISGSGDGFSVPPHHLRFADNIVEYCAGGGIGTGSCDWVTIENNVIRNNSWLTIYATSGISLLGSANFDAQDNVYKWLIRNNVSYGNRTYVAWKQIGKVSDGNGIIIDTNVAKTSGEAFLGRTLIQNNVSFNNGGSGIHAFRCHRIDIINNTAYMNGASPELAWGQIFVQRGDDVSFINNVMWARDGQPVNTNGKDVTDQGSKNVVRQNNIYFGGAYKAIMGEDDLVAAPEFVKPSVVFEQANFKLQPDSPAIGHGRWTPLVPVRDINGNPRPLDGKPDAGAYQH